MASPNPDLTDLVCASNFKDIDLTEQHGPLSQLLSQNVINIHVIFTQSGYDKPHAELALEVETEVQLGCLPNGCLPIKTNKIFLGMNSHLLTTYDDFGSSITLGTPYFHGALLHSLQFDVPAKRRTVREYLQTLRRKAPQDLGTFVNGGNYEIMSGVHSGVQAKPMGSRDFVTQCMIRWKRTTMISWKVKQGQVVGQRREAPLQFSDFITKPYRIENGITRCDGPEIPMEMGIYEDRVTKDFENSYAPINTSPDLSGGIVQFPTTLLHQPIDEILEELPIEQYPLIVNRLRSGLPVQVYPLVPLRPGNRSLPLLEFQTYEAQQLYAGFQAQTEQRQTEFQAQQPYLGIQGQTDTQGQMGFQGQTEFQGQTGFQTQQLYPEFQSQTGFRSQKGFQGQAGYEAQQPFPGFQGQTGNEAQLSHQAFQGQMEQGHAGFQTQQPYPDSQGHTEFQSQPPCQGP